jgi:outer membrane receptor for ferrienterochelin and colicins
MASTGNIIITAVVLCSLVVTAEAQKLMGVVSRQNEQGREEAVPGANVYWLGTGISTTTAENGVFMIERATDSDQLVVSFTGMRSDTITVTDQSSIRVELQSEKMLEAVTIEGWKPTSGMDHTRGINTSVMLEDELFKAACCNLSESFETNPAVDVSFTDAVTGTRQIQMLGLAGPNTLISIENMPGVRGLAGSQGIQLVPGSWINSIEVTKGVGSVVNGYESIAGQINVELKKPEESENLFINGYVNQSGRSEANANFTLMAGKKWATAFLLHASARPFDMDQNEDGFLDFPTGMQINAINRWVFNSGTGWLGQFGVEALRDTKLAGQSGFKGGTEKFTTDRYGLEINTSRIEAWGKLGYQFQGKPYKSVGLQLSATGHDHQSYYGLNGHGANEVSYYGNLVYQSIIGSTNHKFKTGLSFLHSSYNERLQSGMHLMRIIRPSGEEGYAALDFDRLESVPGAFFEYTYNYLDRISVIAGVRVDQHNLFGMFFTPRLHTRFNMGQTSTLRLSAGKGIRVANILTENTGVLASSRQLVFSSLQSSEVYGFRPDVAWNYGLNFSQDFNLNYRPGSLTVDYFYTDFQDQVILDLDESVREANFYPLEGRSFSHSLQFQVDYQLMRRFDMRLAYRWLNVKTDYRRGLMSRPLIAGHRAFANFAYETKNKWKFDYTVQWIGEQRIPDTRMNPDGYQLAEYAPAYMMMNAQVTKDFKDRWSVYLGVENLTNFRLNNPIIASEEPFSPYFDSSLVWGPIFGRMAYAGFRYRL